MNDRGPIAERKKRIMHSVRDLLAPGGEYRLERDLAKAQTHADLDEIENGLESAEAVHDEEELFD